MSLGARTPEVSDRFDRLCKLIGSRGKGLTLREIGAAHALARELEADAPDTVRVRLLLDRLGLDGEGVSK